MQYDCENGGPSTGEYSSARQQNISKLTSSFSHFRLQSYVNSYTEGLLHRNFKGQWYPVCDEQPLDWATEACRNEMDNVTGIPITIYNPGVLPGPFIQRNHQHRAAVFFDHLEPILTETCVKSETQESVLLYVKCPPMQCGLVKKLDDRESLIRVIGIDEMGKNTQSRIVGGDLSAPGSKPYVVAIYRNGHYHCGGTIHNESWVRA